MSSQASRERPANTTISRLLEQLCGETCSEMSVIWNSSISTVFDCKLDESGRERVVKVARGGLGESWVLRERAVLPALTDAGVRVPTVLFTDADPHDTDIGTRFVIMEKLTGSLDTADPLESAREGFVGMGRWLRQMQTMEPAALAVEYKPGLYVIEPSHVEWCDEVAQWIAQGRFYDLYRPFRVLMDSLDLGDQYTWLEKPYEAILESR
jgi:hypothetical protein